MLIHESVYSRSHITWKNVFLCYKYNSILNCDIQINFYFSLFFLKAFFSLVCFENFIDIVVYNFGSLFGDSWKKIVITPTTTWWRKFFFFKKMTLQSEQNHILEAYFLTRLPPQSNLLHLINPSRLKHGLTILSYLIKYHTAGITHSIIVSS